MFKITIQEAKKSLHKYISMLENGTVNEILIVDGCRTVAKLEPIKKSKIRIGAGLLFDEYKPFKLKNTNDGFDNLFGYDKL